MQRDLLQLRRTLVKVWYFAPWIWCQISLSCQKMNYKKPSIIPLIRILETNVMWLSRIHNSSSNWRNRPLIAIKELHNQNENFGYVTSNESIHLCVSHTQNKRVWVLFYYLNKTGCLHERNIQFQFGTRVAKKFSVIKKKKKTVNELGRVKEGRNGGRSGAWRIIVRRLAHKIEARSTDVERLGWKVAAIFFNRSYMFANILWRVFKGRMIHHN